MKLLVLYVLILLTIGIRELFRKSNYGDFIVAGRKCGTFSVVMTLTATLIGASATLGIAEKTAEIGFPAIWWGVAGSLGLLLQGIFLTERIRSIDAHTLPELAKVRVGEMARMIVALMIVIAWPAIVAAQFSAIATLTDAFFDIENRKFVVIAAGLVITAYTAAGGQRGIVKTDKVQMLILFAGFSAVFAMIAMKDGYASVKPGAIKLTNDSFGYKEIILMLFTAGGAYLLGPDITSRAFVAKNGQVAKRAVITAVPIFMIFALMVILSSLSAGSINGEINPVFKIINQLPSLLSGLMAVAILAALVSSADTCLINPSVIFVHDILKVHSVKWLRVTIVVMGIISILLALCGKGIIDLLMISYSIYTPGVVCPLAIALFASNINEKRWLVSVVAGGLCGLLYATILPYEFLPIIGMGISAIGVYLAFK